MPVIDGAGNLIEVAADPAVFGGQLSERGKQLVVDRGNRDNRTDACALNGNSAFSDCLTFSALASRPQLTHAAFHRMVCDGCYHARTIPNGE